MKTRQVTHKTSTLSEAHFDANWLYGHVTSHVITCAPRLSKATSTEADTSSEVKPNEDSAQSRRSDGSHFSTIHMQLDNITPQREM